MNLGSFKRGTSFKAGEESLLCVSMQSTYGTHTHAQFAALQLHIAVLYCCSVHCCTVAQCSAVLLHSFSVG